MHRLYDQTCLERWIWRKHNEMRQAFKEAEEKREAEIRERLGYRPTYREVDRELRRRREVPRKRPSGYDGHAGAGEDAPFSPFPSAASYEAPTAPPDQPASIDPGGGSSGGGGASGDW